MPCFAFRARLTGSASHDLCTHHSWYPVAKLGVARGPRGPAIRNIGRRRNDPWRSWERAGMACRSGGRGCQPATRRAGVPRSARIFLYRCALTGPALSSRLPSDGRARYSRRIRPFIGLDEPLERSGPRFLRPSGEIISICQLSVSSEGSQCRNWGCFGDLTQGVRGNAEVFP